MTHKAATPHTERLDGVKGDVLHFPSVEAGIVCCFDSTDGSGSATILSRSNALKTITDLLTANMRRPNVRMKVIANREILSVLEATLAGQRSLVTAIQEAPSAFEIYFFPDSGRIRFRVLEQATAPVVSAASAVPKPRRKVLIVDDSKTIRMLLRAIISEDPTLEVVAETGAPEEVDSLLERVRPDVMTLDIDMPKIDGVTLLSQVFPKYHIPTVMITAMSREQGNLVLRALELGAVDYIQKPTSENIDAAADSIREKVRAASLVNLRQRQVARPSQAKIVAQGPLRNDVLVAIGSSTGGTEALKVLLSALPKEIPPIVVVQHIPQAFSRALAERLNEACPFEVKEAEDGDPVVPGRVLIARGGSHLEVHGRLPHLVARVSDGPLVSGHKPSVDHLFASVARCQGRNAIGILLTGMGRDGAAMLKEMRAKGAHTIGQNEATCVVYGMPGAAKQLDAVAEELALDQISGRLVQLLALSGQGTKAS